MSINGAAVMEQDKKYIMGTYGRFPMVLVRGEGARVWDADGKEYLDFLGGIAVNVLGHCHPAVVQAIKDQAETLIHTSNFYYTVPGPKLAELLVQTGIGDKVFLCNSGAEANEGALKLARKFHFRNGNQHKNVIISCTHSFHGRTMAALAVTAKPEIQEGFGPLIPGVEYSEFNDLEMLQKKMHENVAAVIIEPVQGEGGINAATQEYLQGVREVTESFGALMIADEIQCGLARTGTFWGFQQYGVQPDIVTVAKGLGGGLPIGAFAARGKAVEGLKPGDHGSTFGGNPVAAAAAVATLQTLLNGNYAAQNARLGQYFIGRLEALKAHHSCIKEVRGLGLMIGVELTIEAKDVVEQCRQMGLIINATAGTVLRFLPPYVITEADIDKAVDIVSKAIARATAAAA